MGVRPVLPRFTGTRFVAGTTVLLGMGVLAACTSASNSSGTTPTNNGITPIVIGASLSLSGGANDPFLADGQAFDRGYELWAKDVNARGGLLGRQVKLVILDDGGSPNQVDHNTFDVSLPVADSLVPLYNWIASLPKSQQPKTAAYPMAQDPFADP